MEDVGGKSWVENWVDKMFEQIGWRNLMEALIGQIVWKNFVENLCGKIVWKNCVKNSVDIFCGKSVQCSV